MNVGHAIEIAALTDVGKARSHNEDSIATDATMGLLVLADGMGGYQAGEVASGLATDEVMREVRERLPGVHEAEEDPFSGLRAASVLLRDAIVVANGRIHAASQSEERMSGMGTTLVSVLFYDNRMSIAHVGDSRLYRVRDNIFQQVTKDHSLLQHLIDQGFYTPEEALKSGKKNVVTRALGVDPSVEVDIKEEDVRVGDIYLLCSDGLNDMVGDHDIHLIISTFSGNLQLAVEQLVQMANDQGGQDNISVVLARVNRAFPQRRGILWRILGWFK
jgi:serine/threonine protein phosphatase PrpC